MSLPEYPTDPSDFTREDIVNQIISSVAMEELGLSHILNAEGEKLQYLLGTLSGASGLGPTVNELLRANESIQRTLSAAMRSEMLLQYKMESALNKSDMRGPTGPTGPEAAVDPDAELLYLGDTGGRVGAVKGDHTLAFATGTPADIQIAVNPVAPDGAEVVIHNLLSLDTPILREIGTRTDATMSQKAVTDALADKADSSDVIRLYMDDFAELGTAFGRERFGGMVAAMEVPSAFWYLMGKAATNSANLSRNYPDDGYLFVEIRKFTADRAIITATHNLSARAYQLVYSAGNPVLTWRRITTQAP